MRRRSSYELAKRLLDVVGAGVGLVATCPAIAAVAIAIRVRLGRPVLFCQSRSGRAGEPFTLVKFRTMRPLAPGEGIADDHLRLTHLGRFLRASSIDELPTLFNVLRGEMSLVGPRPLLPQYLPRYSAHQARRHEVKPGITGWCQVRGRNGLPWEDKLELDVWYVDNASWSLDLRILLLTVTTVLRRQGISSSDSITMPEFMGRALE